MKYEIKEGNYAAMGVTRQGRDLVFTFAAKQNQTCAVLLYDRESGKKQFRIELPVEFQAGFLRSVCIRNIDYHKFDYNYEIDGEVVTDPYARKIVGREHWCDKARQGKNVLRGGFDFSVFHWKEQRPKIKKEDMFLYKLHVRGFTMDTSAANRGTFAALQKKIPYLRELGVTSVELMPVYEFEEIEQKTKDKLPDYVTWKKKAKEKRAETRVNFWGYTRGNYFAPKASFAASDHAAVELKRLIQALHNQGMECILEMFFPAGVPAAEIIDALHYWVLEYHVDGFHLQGENLPVQVIAEDLLLHATKIFYVWFEEAVVAKEDADSHLYFYNDEFEYPIRRMLCGRDASLYEFVNQMRKQQERASYVNYICDNNGFTLADLFSYSEKHNEKNGEKNTDGSSWNYSCNCGAEGETNRKYIKNQRKRLAKNAIAAVFLAQGIPLLFSGDEFGNSQEGNNNAYCQDNAIGWINWKEKGRNRELLEFTRAVIRFRKEHPVFRSPEPMQMCDYKGIGLPDLSYHGEEAWMAGFDPGRQVVGLLYGGGYALRDDATEDDDIYIAFNFHVTEKKLALPKTEKTKGWYRVIDTARQKDAVLDNGVEIEQKQAVIAPQSVAVFVGKR